MQGYAELGRHGANTLLAVHRRATLATLAAGGAPHVVPIVYAGDVQRLWFAVDGKPKRSGRLARLAHIERDPRVSVLVDQYDDDWARLYWLRLDGRARVVARSGAAAEAALAALRARYPQYARVGTGAAADALVCIDVERRAAWCADRWAHVLPADRGGADQMSSN